MLHLSPERLAALADEEPTAVEASHLAGCARCAAERAAHRRLLAMANLEATRPSDPLTSWNVLASELRAEGLIGPPTDRLTLTTPSQGVRAVSRPRRPLGGRVWMRAAAVLLIAGLGAAAGRYSAGPPMFGPAPESTVAEEGAGPSESAGLSYVSYSSSTEAMAAFLRAQREMQQAATYLAEQEQNSSPADAGGAYRARLAALDGMVSVSRAALFEAPADPVINQYYLAALGAREATMRQISRALPVGTQLTAY
jgi:hypothetical protein